jgi:hypothetical protein
LASFISLFWGIFRFDACFFYQFLLGFVHFHFLMNFSLWSISFGQTF